VRDEPNTKKGEKMNKENKGRKYGWGYDKKTGKRKTGKLVLKTFKS
jgi:hypothetical protein